MEHRIVDVERVAPTECFLAQAAIVDELSAEVDRLQMVAHLARQARPELAHRAAVVPRVRVFHNEFLQVPQAHKPV